MNQLSIFSLKALRKLYSKVFRVQPFPQPTCEQDPEVVSRIIYEKLMDDQPCMIARFGAFELNTLVNYLGVKHPNKNLWQYIKGTSLPWWWNKPLIKSMYTNAGFFPPTQEKIKQFCELMLDEMKEVDVLGSWLVNENYFETRLANVKQIKLILLEPFWVNNPWTKALEGKKVLVIHPYARTIEQQYKKKELIFRNNLLPEFELITFKAVQSIGGTKTEFADWFAALDYMKYEVDKIDYDICLIGAGAYGFPLAAHVKRMGKKGFHIGGSLQLLFGIKGKRWENEQYHPTYNYVSQLMNEHWVRPETEEKPLTANIVEGGCYW